MIYDFLANSRIKLIGPKRIGAVEEGHIDDVSGPVKPVIYTGFDDMNLLLDIAVYSNAARRPIEIEKF